MAHVPLALEKVGDELLALARVIRSVEILGLLDRRDTSGDVEIGPPDEGRIVDLRVRFQSLLGQSRLDQLIDFRGSSGDIERLGLRLFLLGLRREGTDRQKGDGKKDLGKMARLHRDGVTK